MCVQRERGINPGTSLHTTHRQGAAKASFKPSPRSCLCYKTSQFNEGENCDICTSHRFADKSYLLSTQTHSNWYSPRKRFPRRPYCGMYWDVLAGSQIPPSGTWSALECVQKALFHTRRSALMQGAGSRLAYSHWCKLYQAHKKRRRGKRSTVGSTHNSSGCLFVMNSLPVPV